jgi:hypothetical protein
MCVSSDGGSMIRWNSARDEGVKILWNARLSCHDRVVAPSRAELCVLLVVLNGVPDGAALTEVDLSELGIAGALTNHPHAQHLGRPHNGLAARVVCVCPSAPDSRQERGSHTPWLFFVCRANVTACQQSHKRREESDLAKTVRLGHLFYRKTSLERATIPSAVQEKSPEAPFRTCP